MDCINIDKLKVYAYHGVFEFEKKEGQEFYISASLFLDIQKAMLNDSLEDTINYADVCVDIKEFATANCFDLIETLAERLAVFLLNKYDNAKEISLTVSKPNAPVDMEFEDISVTVSRKRHEVFVAFGSNLGESEDIINKAIEELDKSEYCKVLKKSSFYKSKPYGEIEQPDFVNGVLMLETYLEPFNLLRFLNDIEAKAKRTRLVHWGPRTLDLDIIFYDDEIISTEKLSVPHIDMCNRDFVLEPLCEIAPYKVHPTNKKTVAELLKMLGEHYVYKMQ